MLHCVNRQEPSNYRLNPPHLVVAPRPSPTPPPPRVVWSTPFHSHYWMTPAEGNHFQVKNWEVGGLEDDLMLHRAA